MSDDSKDVVIGGHTVRLQKEEARGVQHIGYPRASEAVTPPDYSRLQNSLGPRGVCPKCGHENDHANVGISFFGAHWTDEVQSNNVLVISCARCGYQARVPAKDTEATP